MRALWLATLVLAPIAAVVHAAEPVAAPAASSSRAPHPGMRVQLDAQGRPIAVPTGPGVSGVPHAGQAARAARQPPVEQDAPGGGRMIVNDRLRSMTVGRIGADGRVTVECVHGHPAAARTASEGSNDAR